MIYYGNPCNEKVKDAISAGIIGCITQPEQRNIIFPEEWDTIGDNGCFSNKWKHEYWFEWMINLPRTVRWLTAPDVFLEDGSECHEATMERWNYYAPIIERHGFTPAFVCQVGCTPENMPDAEVFFLGGTTEWKIGEPAELVSKEAKRRGAWLHMGRVNSLKRLRIAASFGCDSVDGTYLKYGPDKNLPKLTKWMNMVNEEIMEGKWK